MRFPALFKKWWSRILLTLVSIFVVIVILLFAAVSYLGSLPPLLRHTPTESPSAYGLEYSPVSFPTSDGLNIKGWWIEAGVNAPVVIFLHGSFANRATPAERVFGIASQLFSRGYSVLMFDFRGQGESEGDQFSAGLYESDDVLSAVRFLKERNITAPIGVLGFSLGAATGLIAASESDDICCVVADSSYTDVVSVIKAQFEKRSYLPDFLLPVLMFAAKIAYGVDFSLVSPENALTRMNTPVFIIHGGRDDTIPVSEAFELKAVCQNPASEFWVVPEAAHTDAYSVRPVEYVGKLISFLDTTLGVSPDGLPA